MTAVAILSPSGIYSITNTVNGKKYIGSAVNIKARISRHKLELRRGEHHSQKLQNAWNKYGSDAFVFSVVEFVELRSDLIAREQEWIIKHSSCECGYNVLAFAGSALGYKHRPESIAKFSASRRGIKFSEEHKAKLSEWQKGSTHSDETKAKRSAALKGRPRHPDVVAKMGRKNSPETIAKRIATRRRNGGYVVSEERLAKMRLIRPSEDVKRKISEALKGRKVPAEVLAKREATRKANKLAALRRSA